MANKYKKAKFEADNESSSDSENSESDRSSSLLNQNEEKMQVDFAAFPLCMEDYDGIVRFLEKVFPSSLPIARDLANILLKNNDIGSVMKIEEEPIEDEEDFVYSIVSAVDLSNTNDIASSIRKFLIDSCPEKKEKKSCLLMALKEGRVALVISERAHNLPHQLSLPQLHSLKDELSKLPGRPFTHFILISNLTKPLHEKQHPEKKQSPLMHTRAEEEVLLESAEITYKIIHSDSEESTPYMKKVALISSDHWNSALKRLSNM